jgi:hypothetical protein
MYTILFQGYETGTGHYLTLAKARKALVEFKREDKEECRRKFGRAKVSGNKDIYRVEFGANLFSAGGIAKY